MKKKTLRVRITKSAHKDKKNIKRIEDLEVNEFSLVDKPAIGETFILTKCEHEDPKIALAMLEKKDSWIESTCKAVNNENKECLFCGITAEEEQKTIGAGLRCSVCLSCAFEYAGEGVADECIAGTFDKEKFEAIDVEDETDSVYQSLIPKNSDDEEALKTSLEQRSDRFGVEISEDANLTYPNGAPADLGLYGDPVNLKFAMKTIEHTRSRFKKYADDLYKEEKSKRIIHERIVLRELSLGIKPSFDPEDDLDELLSDSLKSQLKNDETVGDNSEEGDETMAKKQTKKETSKKKDETEETVESRIGAVEKSTEQLKEMLERTLSLHDAAAVALNEMFSLNMSSLDTILSLTSEKAVKIEAEDGEELTDEEKTHNENVGLFAELRTQMTEARKSYAKELKDSEKEGVEKAGAKISSTRLKTLREIAEKLSALITSVEGVEKDEKEETEKSVKEVEKSITGVSKSIEGLNKKLDDLAKKFEDLESTAGASSDINTDEEPDDEDEERTNKSTSVFKGVLGLEDIKMDIQKRDNFFKDKRKK